MVITAATAATISLVSLLIGGSGVFMYFHYADSDEMPNIANSSFGTFDWHKTSKTDLIGVDFNLNSGGVIFEVGMIITFMFIIAMFCCCGCKHLPTPRCIKERRHKKKAARRERYRKKKERLREEEEEETQRRRWKHEKRHRDHYRKLSKQIRDNHWSVRFIDEGRRNQIHRLASGEGVGQNSGAEKHRIVKGHHEDREKEGSLATTGMGETRRNSSRVDSSSMWSGTTATSSDWYCGKDIHTKGSVYS